MEIEVIRPGLFTSIQDLGRPGLSSFGVPTGGVMDAYAALFANSLVQNSKEDAVLEITLLGPKLSFKEGTEVALSGLDGEVLLNEKKIEINQVISIRKGDLLDIKRVTKGCRLYLAISGGFLTEKMLGSRSMIKGITSKEKIEEGDRLPFTSFHRKNRSSYSTLRFDHQRYQNHQITVFPGPEFDQLTAAQTDSLFKMEFHLSAQSNRMAYLIEETLKNRLSSILTGPVLPGTVQWTPGGRLLVLMKDSQVTGGYPRILQVSKEGLFSLSQKKPGERIQFKFL